MEESAGGENLPLGPSKGRSSMLPQFQRHEEDNVEAAERREQRLLELLRQSNEMQSGMSAQIEALKAQITELQSPTSRRPEQYLYSFRNICPNLSPNCSSFYSIIIIVSALSV